MSGRETGPLSEGGVPLQVVEAATRAAGTGESGHFTKMSQRFLTHNIARLSLRFFLYNSFLSKSHSKEMSHLSCGFSHMH